MSNRHIRSVIDIDVMTDKGERYYGTLHYEYNPCFRLSSDDIKRAVLQRFPTLKHKKFTIAW